MPVSCLFLCCLITLTICIYLCERFIKAQRKQMDKLIKSLSFSLKILLYLKMIMLGLGDHVTGYYEFKNIIIVHFSINLFYVIFSYLVSKIQIFAYTAVIRKYRTMEQNGKLTDRPPEYMSYKGSKTVNKEQSVQ